MFTTPFGTVAILIAILIGIIGMLTLPSAPVGRFLREKKQRRERSFWEDILRQTLQMEQDGRVVTAESLAGTLRRPITFIRRVMARMAERDLLTGEHHSVRLTPVGKRWALHVLRAHRLWESYLADEARLPMNRIHDQAERAEHHLSESDLAALDAHLGHPLEDPHGDPIPTAEGYLERPHGTPLPSWEGGEFVKVAHVEDEPQEIFNRLLSKGVRPGVSLRLIAASPNAVEALLDGQTVLLEQDVLPNIEVVEDTDTLSRDPQVTRLSHLATGETGEIFALSDAIRGFSRRRLLDFGVTRGTRIAPVLDNPFGDPRAFRVRGTTIGIRDEQAQLIWVRRVAEKPAVSGGIA